MDNFKHHQNTKGTCISETVHNRASALRPAAEATSARRTKLQTRSANASCTNTNMEMVSEWPIASIIRTRKVPVSPQRCTLVLAHCGAHKEPWVRGERNFKHDQPISCTNTNSEMVSEWPISSIIRTRKVPVSPTTVHNRASALRPAAEATSARRTKLQTRSANASCTNTNSEMVSEWPIVKHHQNTKGTCISETVHNRASALRPAAEATSARRTKLQTRSANASCTNTNSEMVSEWPIRASSEHEKYLYLRNGAQSC